MSPIKACVIGWPISHSRSPLIHGFWLEQYGIDGAYSKEAVDPDALGQFLDAMPARGYAGANVTVPHKEMAFALSDEIDDSARAAGAANTLWFRKGKLCASNTDTYGFLMNLDESAPGWDKTKCAVVLGAGGAARAVLKGLMDRGIREIRLLNRTPQRADALAERFGVKVKSMPWDTRSRALRGAGLLVNTTCLGMAGHPGLDIDLKGMDKKGVVSDLVYTPLRTWLLGHAEERGLTAVDGLGMLLHQAVPGFEKWFGVRPEVTPQLRAAVVADLKRG